MHLLVVWWLVNLQDARCNNKDNSVIPFAIQNLKIKIHRKLIVSFVLRVYETCISRKLSWRFSAVGYWGRYLCLKETRKCRSGKYYARRGLYNLYFSPNIFWVINSRWMRWAGHVACMGERKGRSSDIYDVLHNYTNHSMTSLTNQSLSLQRCVSLNNGNRYGSQIKFFFSFGEVFCNSDI